jgi:drug/metabolite transporter (DMT)-like permease
VSIFIALKGSGLSKKQVLSKTGLTKQCLRFLLKNDISSLLLSNNRRRALDNSKNSVLPFVCLVIATILWASTFVVLKIAFRVYDPMVVIFGRMLVASLCALCVPSLFKNINFRLKDVKYIAFMVICEPCLYFVFEARALVYTTAAQAGMVTSMMPLLVAVAAFFFLKEKLTKNIVLGLSIAIAGTMWLSYLAEPSASGPDPALGNFLEFMAMVCAAGYAISLKKLTSHYSPWLLTFLQAFAGSLFFFPVLFFPGVVLPTVIDPLASFCVLYLGAVVTLGAYGLYNFGVSKIPASQATSFINLIPVFTMILSALILGEWFTEMQYLASCLVFAGVLLSQSKIGTKKELNVQKL